MIFFPAPSVKKRNRPLGFMSDWEQKQSLKLPKSGSSAVYGIEAAAPAAMVGAHCRKGCQIYCPLQGMELPWGRSFGEGLGELS